MKIILYLKQKSGHDLLKLENLQTNTLNIHICVLKLWMKQEGNRGLYFQQIREEEKYAKKELVDSMASSNSNDTPQEFVVIRMK